MKEKLRFTWWPEGCDFAPVDESGAHIRRLTLAPALTKNIYGEQPYCSADGNFLPLLRRYNPNPKALSELLIYEVATNRLALLQEDVADAWVSLGVACSAYTGVLYVTSGVGREKRVIRIDLNSLEREELWGWGDIPAAGLDTVSADGRYGLGWARTGDQMYGIFRVALDSGRWEMIYESPDVRGPHLQYRLRTADRILVQENRGSIFDQDNKRLRATDERGVGLITLGADGKNRREFPVGPPYTPPTGGHQCWIGDTDRAIVTLQEPYNDGQRTGTVVEISHDWPKARVVFDSPYLLHHISVSKCGRFFVADTPSLPTWPLFIGSIRTGKARQLCISKASGGGPPWAHPHPYMTPDNKWVVFNSDCTGLGQTYMASIPDGFLDELES